MDDLTFPSTKPGQNRGPSYGSDILRDTVPTAYYTQQKKSGRRY